MATQEELAAELAALKAQVAKIGGETSGLLADPSKEIYLAAAAKVSATMSGIRKVIDATPTSGGNNSVVPAKFTMELVSPRASGSAPSTDSGTPTMPSGHRIFRAYPGIPYNIRAVVLGGSYPFTHVLSNAPSGMTINSRTGEINWPNPTANATPTITVTDSEGTVRSSSWTITVDASSFRFVDATNGNDSWDGTSPTFVSGTTGPWQTLLRVYQDNVTTARTVYFRAGTYTTNGLPSDSDVDPWPRVKFAGVRQWIGYPGDAMPSIDCGYVAGSASGHFCRLNETPQNTYPTYVDGIWFRNQKNILLQIGTGTHYLFLRRLRLSEQFEGVASGNPSGVMYLTGAGSSFSYYGAFQDVEAFDLDSGGPFKTYSLYKFLCEDLNCHDTSAGPDIKAYTGRWEVRNSILDCNRSTDSWPGIFGNMNNGPTPSIPNNGEVRYNRCIADNASQFIIEIGQDGNCQEVHVYRNTFVLGIVNVLRVNAGQGPINFQYNVIVNENSGTDHITLTLSTASRVTYLDNLAGGAALGIVDGSGLLQGTYRTTYLGSRGHEIP